MQFRIKGFFPPHLDFLTGAAPPADAGGSDPMRRPLCFLTIVVLFSALFSACTRITEMTQTRPAQPTPSPTPVLHPPEKIDADLERAIAGIAQAADGKVGVGALMLETGDAAYLDRSGHFAMQSVYKLPIAMAVAQLIDSGKYK